jgi:signal peptidase I
MQQDFSIPPPPPDATENLYVGSNEPNSAKGWRGILSTLAILIAAPILALLLTSFVFQSYEVDGPSMETTLQNRDRLIVWKVPRTIASLTNGNYVPKRSDVIVFIKRGLYEAGKQDKQLIKRVIGVPGDRVIVNNGYITIYNKENPNGFNPDINHDFSPNISPITTGNIDLTVPEGEVFVCGDNRTNSLDSRAFGTVPSEDIVGKLVVRIFPLNAFKSY